MRSSFASLQCAPLGARDAAATTLLPCLQQWNDQVLLSTQLAMRKPHQGADLEYWDRTQIWTPTCKDPQLGQEGISIDPAADAVPIK